MKNRIQITPALTAALLCAAGWFIIWLFAFRPASLPPVIQPVRPKATHLVADDQTWSRLRRPTLFALPSAEGFSGRFSENRIELPLTLEKPSNPVQYLPREAGSGTGVDRDILMEKTTAKQSALPIPGATTRTDSPAEPQTQLFLSPELKTRAGEFPPLNISAVKLPETVRVNLTVRMDGTVESAFFETPITNAALLSAIRLIPFKPAKEKSEGWIDIRFPQERK